MIIMHSIIDRHTIGYDIYNTKMPFILNMPIRFWIYDDSCTKLTVPEYFKSDGATITLKLAKFIIGCEHNPLFFPAVILHDYMCCHKDKYKRKLASDVMLYLLLERGVLKWQAYLMYICVELYQKYHEGWQ